MRLFISTILLVLMLGVHEAQGTVCEMRHVLDCIGNLDLDNVCELIKHIDRIGECVQKVISNCVQDTDVKGMVAYVVEMLRDKSMYDQMCSPTCESIKNVQINIRKMLTCEDNLKVGIRNAESNEMAVCRAYNRMVSCLAAAAGSCEYLKSSMQAAFERTSKTVPLRCAKNETVIKDIVQKTTEASSCFKAFTAELNDSKANKDKECGAYKNVEDCVTTASRGQDVVLEEMQEQLDKTIQQIPEHCRPISGAAGCFISTILMTLLVALFTLS